MPKVNRICRAFTAFCKSHAPLRWLFVSRDGRVMIAQWPNISLWTAIALYLVAMLTHGSASQWATGLEALALAYWSLLEVWSGDSRFRRLLGLYVLVMQGLRLARLL